VSIVNVISQFVDVQIPVTPVALKYSIIAEGDSLTANEVNGGAPGCWPELLHADLSDTIYPYVQNFAVAGQQVRGAMNSTTQINEIVLARKFDCTENILVLLAGINDIQAEVSGGVGLYNDIVSYVSNFKRYDFKTIVFTLTYSRATAFDSAKHLRMKTETDIYNNLLLDGWNTDLKADVLIDLQSYPLFGGYDTPITSPYFMTDHLHYSPTGKNALKDLIKSAILICIDNNIGIVKYN